MLAGLGMVVREVRTPSALDGLDGLVLPGGESTAMARAGAATGLFEEVRARRESGLPLFGTCAGLVLLADRVQGGQALGDHTTVGGLDLTARRNAFGGQRASSTAPLRVSAFPGRAFPGHLHPGTAGGAGRRRGRRIGPLRDGRGPRGRAPGPAAGHLVPSRVERRRPVPPTVPADLRRRQLTGRVLRRRVPDYISRRPPITTERSGGRWKTAVRSAAWRAIHRKMVRRHRGRVGTSRLVNRSEEMK